MSQITTCPSCSTRFRVVADQLRISDGWVRCGQCQEVFDARLHLGEPASVVTPTAPAATVPVRAVASAVAAQGSGAWADPQAELAAAPQPSAVQGAAPSVRANFSTGALREAPVAVPPQVAPPPPTPGYELPAPPLADDIDFSHYQSESLSGEVSRTFDEALTPSVAAPSGPSDRTPESLPLAPSEDPGVRDVVPQSMTERVDPAWDTPPPVASRPDFPSLDLSILQVASYVEPPAADAAALFSPSAALAAPQKPDASASTASISTQNNVSSILNMPEKLLKEEQKLPGDGASAAPASAALPVTSAALASAWPEVQAPLTVPAEPQVASTTAEHLAPAVDDLESAARRLAQADAALAQGSGGWASLPAGRTAEDSVTDDALAADPDLEPGFVRDARRKAWWQKPVVRVAMGAGVVLLPVALLLQIGLHERNALVAWQPSLRPALHFMCTALQCQLGARQQIAALVVSGSAFAKAERDRTYQLSLSIQNKASTPVGMPAVELTLTDTQDQAIARRVITAKELGAPAELRAGSEWTGTVPVTTNGLNLQVSGYRVLLFYP